MSNVTREVPFAVSYKSSKLWLVYYSCFSSIDCISLSLINLECRSWGRWELGCNGVMVPGVFWPPYSLLSEDRSNSNPANPEGVSSLPKPATVLFCCCNVVIFQAGFGKFSVHDFCINVHINLIQLYYSSKIKLIQLYLLDLLPCCVFRMLLPGSTLLPFQNIVFQ
jgi:hypothetical protein